MKSCELLFFYQIFFCLLCLILYKKSSYVKVNQTYGGGGKNPPTVFWIILCIFFSSCAWNILACCSANFFISIGWLKACAAACAAAAWGLNPDKKSVRKVKKMHKIVISKIISGTSVSWNCSAAEYALFYPLTFVLLILEYSRENYSPVHHYTYNRHCFFPLLL